MWAGVEEMIDLKTLKDIEFICCSGSECDDMLEIKENLKQEAIKWAKLIETECLYNRSSYVIWFIKDFFNITEEDLK